MTSFIIKIHTCCKLDPAWRVCSTSCIRCCSRASSLLRVSSSCVGEDINQNTQFDPKKIKAKKTHSIFYQTYIFAVNRILDRAPLLVQGLIFLELGLFSIKLAHALVDVGQHLFDVFAL